jgi:integrase
VHIPDSKSAAGIGDMPMTALAREAFRSQITLTPGSEYLFPSPKPKAKKPHITNLRKVWADTLLRAGVPYFSLYELRHTFATRLSAGGVADHFVTQMLRQGDSGVFKRYSQAKLKHDAGSARQTGPASERARREFRHSKGELADS